MIPDLGIVVPCRDGERFLPSLGDSLAELDYPKRRIELVFVDDASRDASAELARSRLSGLGFGRFELVRRPVSAGRPGPAKNAGLALTRAPILCCLDCDDELLDVRAGLERFGQDSGLDVVYGEYVEADASGEHLVSPPPYADELLRTQNILPATSFFRRALFEKSGGYRQASAYEDWDFWVRAAALGFRFGKIDALVYRRRRAPGSFSDLARAEDGPAKAAVVLGNRGFFPPAVLRWAKAVRAGAPGVPPFERGIIPPAVLLADS